MERHRYPDHALERIRRGDDIGSVIRGAGGVYERECPVMQHYNHDDQAADRDPDPAQSGFGSSGPLSGSNGQPLDELSRAAGDEVFDILCGVGQQIERLRGLHRGHDDKLAALTERSRAIETAREQLAATAAELEARHRELDRQQAQFDEQQASGETDRAELDRQRDELDRRTRDLVQREAALKQRQAEFSPERFDELSDRCQSLRDQLSADESQITELGVELDHRTQQVDAKVKQFREAEEQIQSLQQQVTELQRTVAETNERAESLNREADSKDAALTDKVYKLEATARERSATLDEYRDKIQAAQARIRDLGDTLDKQQSRLEEGAEAIATVQQQRQQIGELTSQLAQYEVGSDPDQLRQKDERIEELVEALHQTRGQSLGERSHAESEARIQELMTENDRLRVEAERGGAEAQEALRQLEPHDHERSVDDGEVIVALHQRIEQLARELAGACAVDPHPARGRFDHPAEGAGYEAQRLRVEAQHLQRRRVRLARLRRALRARTRPSSLFGSETEVNSFDLPDQKRHARQLMELRKVLAASEREMILKWARPRAVVTLGWVAILAVIVAGASWFLADHVAPATVSASIRFEAKNRSGLPVSSEEAESWRTWHTNQLVDTGFTNTLAKRLADRRLDRFADPSVLSQRFDADLTIDASQGGIMTVSLAGTDPQEITALLDALATTLVTESSRQMSKRGDGPHAVVKGGTKEGDRLRYATLNPIPIHDERVQFAGYVFGAAFPACLLLIWVIYRRLARTKGVSDDSDAMFIVPAV